MPVDNNPNREQGQAKVTATGACTWLREHLPLLRNILAWICLAAIVTSYARFEIACFTPAYQEVDPDGYLVLAKRIANGGPLAIKDEDIFRHHSHVWVENDRGEVIPKFAPGYPAIMAIFYKFGGDEAMFWVSPFCGVLALVGAFMLFRLWMSSVASLAAVACLAWNKLFLVYTGYMLTHSLDVCVVTWGMYFLFRWRREGGIGSAVGAGLVLGFACAVRHTGVLLAIVILIAMISRGSMCLKELIAQRRTPAGEGNADLRQLSLRPLVSIAVLAVAYAAIPCLLAIYNKVIFGNPLTTGYYFTNEQAGYSWDQFRRMLPVIASGLGTEGLMLTFEVGIVGILALGPWSEGLMRFFWVAPLIALHAAYYWAGGRIEFIRFFLCLFPAFIGSAFAVIDRASSLASRRFVAILLFAALVIGLRAGQMRDGMNSIVCNPSSRSLAETGRMISRVLRDDAVIFSQRDGASYLGTLCSFTYYEIAVFTSQYGWSSGWSFGPRQQPKRTDRLKEFYGKHDERQLQEMKKDIADRALANGKQVVFMLHPRAEKRELELLGPGYEFVPIAWPDAATDKRGDHSQFRLHELRKKKSELGEGSGLGKVAEQIGSASL